MAVNGLWQVTSGLDRLVILLMLTAALLGLWRVSQRERGAEVIIEQDGRVVFVAPLGEDVQADIEGPLGSTQVRIAGGAVCVTGATCPERICMALGSIQHAGDVLACLPNRVLIRVVGGEQEPGYDLLSQ